MLDLAAAASDLELTTGPDTGRRGRYVIVGPGRSPLRSQTAEWRPPARPAGWLAGTPMTKIDVDATRPNTPETTIFTSRVTSIEPVGIRVFD